MESEAEALVALARIRAAWYKLGAPHQKLPAGHGAILVPFGDDMKFQNANKQYGTFRLNFHHFDRFELDPRGHTQP